MHDKGLSYSVRLQNLTAYRVFMPFTFYSRSSHVLNHWPISMYHKNALLPYQVTYHESFTCDDRYGDCHIQVSFAPFANVVEHFQRSYALSYPLHDKLQDIDLRIDCQEQAAAILPKPPNQPFETIPENETAKHYCFPGGTIKSNTVRLNLQKELG